MEHFHTSPQGVWLLQANCMGGVHGSFKIFFPMHSKLVYSSNTRPMLLRQIAHWCVDPQLLAQSTNRVICLLLGGVMRIF